MAEKNVKAAANIRPNPNGDWPQIDSASYIDPTAQVIGNVHIGSQVYVGPNAVIRADESDDNGQVNSITIGAECNVQDGVIIHALAGTQVTIGKRTSLAHGCIIHGQCTLGEGCFIGFGSKIFKASLADDVYVGTAAVVQGVELAGESFVPACAAILSAADVANFVTTIGLAERAFMQKVVNANLVLVEGYIRISLAAT
ncbi:MAG: hexapeptide transferase [Planctomycetes bacterium]|nr:hexapeptide transferase [Planctomycetota bacterium]